MHKIKFIAIKEMRHILRDPRSLIIIFAMPALMTFLYGFAINMDTENVTIAVMDYDQTAKSREFIAGLYASSYFSPPEHPPDLYEPERTLRSQEAAGLLIIRKGFSEAITKGLNFELGLTVDGSDNQKAAAAVAYTEGAVNQFMFKQVPEGINPPRINISRQVLYNPDLKSAHYFVPAIVAIILIMISALLTSITIAREKETGTIEQLLVAPVTPLQILIGKIAPYIAIAFA
ncbi:MAG: ABC transporter permease, partial [candidate division Zixibacteria bacterium]